jgi:hypothetical protein
MVKFRWHVITLLLRSRAKASSGGSLSVTIAPTIALQQLHLSTVIARCRQDVESQ